MKRERDSRYGVLYLARGDRHFVHAPAAVVAVRLVVGTVGERMKRTDHESHITHE